MEAGMHSQTSSVDALAGVQHIPLLYVIRSNASRATTVPPLATGFPLAAGSVEQELLIDCSLHTTHPLFRDDNAEVYYKIEEATQLTQYAASIKPFQQTQP